MTAQAGAVLDEPARWEAIDWSSIEHHVRRLQIRIVKAVKEGRWNKVKALQHLLTHASEVSRTAPLGHGRSFVSALGDSIRVRRCAPGSDCWARLGSVGFCPRSWPRRAAGPRGMPDCRPSSVSGPDNENAHTLNSRPVLDMLTGCIR
jgi:N-terminal domain of reverse transcriptase